MTTSKGKISEALKEVEDAGKAYTDGEAGAQLQLATKAIALMREAAGPQLYLARMAAMPMVNLCQLMASEMGLTRALTLRGGEPVTAKALAAETGREELLIVRVLRLLAVVDVVTETGPGEYCSNSFTETLDTPGMEGVTRNIVELVFPIGGKIVPWLREQASASSKSAVLPFEYTFGARIFDWFGKGNDEHKLSFDNWMEGRHSSLTRPWFEKYPLATEVLPHADQSKDSVLVVDVAGGKGHDIARLRAAFPDVAGRLVLQDLPQTIALSIGELTGVETMPYNFFQEQPIKGAKVYFYRAVFHDWPDVDALEMLKRVAAAMKPGYSKLIVQDKVLADAGASLEEAMADITIYLMNGGIERTHSAWIKILADAGLRLVKVWREPGAADCVMEIERQ